MSKKWLAVLPLIALSLMPGMARADTWSTYRHDHGRSGYTPESIALPLAVNWKFSTLGISGNPSSPVTYGSYILFAAGNVIYALDSATGAERWNSGSTIEGIIKSTPSIVDGIIYVGSSSGKLYAFAPVGQAEWKPIWYFQTGGAIRSSAVMVDGIVYFGSDDNCIYAVDAKDGKQVWKRRTTGDISAAAAWGEDRIVFTSSDLMTYAVDTSNRKGVIRWKYRTRLSSNHSSPVVEADRLYLAAGNQIFCLSVRTGRERWSHTLVPDISCSPAVHDGTVYFATLDSQLWAVGERGKLQWKAKLDFPCYAPPTIAGNTLLVATNKGEICAFDLKEAQKLADAAAGNRKAKAPLVEPRWKYRVQLEAGRTVMPDITSSLVVCGNALYALPDDGTLHCFTPTAPDVDPPAISLQNPPKNSAVNGKPPLLLVGVLQDEGSGLNESTIAMYLDKDADASSEPGVIGGPSPLDSSFDPLRGIVYFRTPVTQPARPLADGKHTVTVVAADWKGNLLESSWTFNVDNRLPDRPLTNTDPNAAPMGGGPGGPPGTFGGGKMPNGM